MKSRLFTFARVALLILVLALAVPAFAQRDGRDSGHKGPGDRWNIPDGLRARFDLARMMGQITMLEMDEEVALSPGQAKQVLGILDPLRDKPKLSDSEAKTASTKLQKVFTLDQMDALAEMSPRGRGSWGGGKDGKGFGKGGPWGGGKDGKGFGKGGPWGGGKDGKGFGKGGPWGGGKDGKGFGKGGPWGGGKDGKGFGKGGPWGGGKNGKGFGKGGRWDPEAMKEINPFYAKPAKDDWFGQMQAKGLEDFFKALETKARHK